MSQSFSLVTSLRGHYNLFGGAASPQGGNERESDPDLWGGAMKYDFLL